MPQDPDRPPFVGGWIGCLHYELGGILEPAAAALRRPEVGTSELLLWQYCPAAYVFDHHQQVWWVVGEPDAERWLPPLGSCPSAGQAESACVSEAACQPSSKYQGMVARAVEYIRAGDVFQVNLAHALQRQLQGSTRALFASMMGRAAPWYGAYLEDENTYRAAYLSMSPELFLDYSPHTRRVVTRPIKGTRPVSPTAETDLSRSGKDAAELAMIVDLMRNDLGRVCEYGSVSVDESRAYERHGGHPGGVVHSVATISGRLRDGLGIEDLLRATFPGGSVTGAPKIRAMQIIDELEATPRGAYTGSIGYISDCGRACFNIAIRTAVVENGVVNDAKGAALLDHVDSATLRYHVGAGIVADSEPELEWQETIAKARVFTDIDGSAESGSTSELKPRPLVQHV